MTFEQLRYFTALAKNLNFTKTSEQLFISQPTLSRQILLLEEEIGVKLFIRDNKSMQISTAGEVFLDECTELLLKYDKMNERMQQFVTGNSGTLVVSSRNIYYPELTSIYRGFCQTNPNLNLFIQYQQTGIVSDSILRGDGDVGVCFSFEMPESTDELEVVELFEENFCLILSNKHPLANQRSVSIQTLKNENLIFLGLNSFKFIRNLWEATQLSNMIGVKLRHPDSIETILLNVRSGVAASIIPAPVARENLAECVMVEMEGVDSTFHTIMCWQKRNPNPALRLFKSYFLDVLPKLITNKSE